MNRKAETTMARVLVEIIIFIFIFLGFFLISVKIWNFYAGKPLGVTENSMKLLGKHIKYFEEEDRIFPLQVSGAYFIQGFNKENTTDKCKKACICMCKSECEGENIKKCMDLTYGTLCDSEDLTKEELKECEDNPVVLAEDFKVSSTEIINYRLSHLNGVLTIAPER